MLPAPRLLLVGSSRAEPALAVFLVERNLAERSIDQAHQTLRDEPQGLVEVDGGCDGAADVRAELQLLAMTLRLFVQASGLARHRHLPGGCTQRFDLAPIRPPL